MEYVAVFVRPRALWLRPRPCADFHPISPSPHRLPNENTNNKTKTTNTNKHIHTQQKIKPKQKQAKYTKVIQNKQQNNKSEPIPLSSPPKSINRKGNKTKQQKTKQQTITKENNNQQQKQNKMSTTRKVKTKRLQNPPTDSSKNYPTKGHKWIKKTVPERSPRPQTAQKSRRHHKK